MEIGNHAVKVVTTAAVAAVIFVGCGSCFISFCCAATDSEIITAVGMERPVHFLGFVCIDTIVAYGSIT